MTFRYFKTFRRREPERPRGLFAYNREGDRLDTIIYDHIQRRWSHDPDAVGASLFGDDQDLKTEISREQAEELARTMLGRTLPSEDELMAISDRAERRRARRFGN
jgi:hypothetical protein